MPKISNIIFQYDTTLSQQTRNDKDNKNYNGTFYMLYKDDP